VIRVVIADDHGIVLAGLRAVLAAEPDIEVLAEATDGRAAIAAVEEHAPDLLVIDLSMPDLNGVEVIRRLHELRPATRIVVLSMHAAPEYVRPALRAGAAGYLVKGSGLEDLVRALRLVAAGETFLGPEAQRVVQREDPRRGEPPDALDRLTAREREVLQLIAEGRTNRQIATLLEVTPKTVDTHRTRLMHKLDLHDTAALTRFAMRHGLIGAE
jgi:two-component system, NarL family, response regulator NreC